MLPGLSMTGSIGVAASSRQECHQTPRVEHIQRTKRCRRIVTRLEYSRTQIISEDTLGRKRGAGGSRPHEMIRERHFAPAHTRGSSPSPRNLAVERFHGDRFDHSAADSATGDERAREKMDLAEPNTRHHKNIPRTPRLAPTERPHAQGRQEWKNCPPAGKSRTTCGA